MGEESEVGPPTSTVRAYSDTHAENSDVTVPNGDHRVYHYNDDRLASRRWDAIREQVERSRLLGKSSSFNKRTPLWPHTFQRQMEYFSRSRSARIKVDFSVKNEEVVRSTEGGVSVASAAFVDHESNDNLKRPLLTKSKVSRSILGKTENQEESDVEYAAALPEYDEFVVGNSSFVQACLNGTNALAGVGILSTPYALAKGGWISLGFLVLFSLICLYTGILLRRCLDVNSSVVTYPDIGQAAFGAKGRFLVSALLYFELYCVSVEFLILEGDNLASLFPRGNLHFGGWSLTALELYIVGSAILFMPTVWLRDLSWLSYISAGGVLAVVAIVSVVGYVGVSEVGFSQSGHLMHLDGFPVAAGIWAFCFCGHAVFPNICRSMKDPKQFSKVLIICFIAVTLLYGGIAILGYRMFGESLDSQVTLNLPSELISSRVAIWIVLVNPFAKFALTTTPVAVALEEFLPWDPKSREFIYGSMCLRSLLVLSIAIVALTVPFFGLMMAFIGSFASCTVSMILPCVCYLKIFGRSRLSTKEVLPLYAVMFIGSVTAFVGTWTAVRGMISSSD